MGMPALPCATKADGSPWWQVDLEGFYQISGSKIVFPRDGNWQFAIDASTDGTTWTRGVDRSQTPNTAPTRNDIYPPGTVARYIRLSFATVPPGDVAGLAELEVHGVLSVR